MDQYINLTKDNIMSEHVCCAIADKKHQCGVNNKKEWLMNRLSEGHIFRKLDAKAKVFIEYAPLETAWVPIESKEVSDNNLNYIVSDMPTAVDIPDTKSSTNYLTVPNGFLYIYCLWVSGSFKGKGHGRRLLDYCIEDAKAKSIPCVFNNLAVFYKGKFNTVHLLNEGYLEKLLAK